MPENIVEYIINLCKEKFPNDPEPTDNEIHDFIDFNTKKVWSGDHKKHRWYTMYWDVHELPDGRYVRIPKVDCNEGQDYFDCLNFSTDDIVEVFPKQILSTIYVKEKPEEPIAGNTFIDIA